MAIFFQLYNSSIFIPLGVSQYVYVCPPTASDLHSWWCKRGRLVQVVFLFLQFHVRSDRRNNYTLVILFQTLIPFIPRPRCLSLDYASPTALIFFYRRQKAMLYRNVKKSWKRASKILYLPSLLWFLYLLFFLYFAIGFLIRYLDEK